MPGSPVAARELRGGAAEGPRGGEAVEGPRGDVAVRGPDGNILVGTRVYRLPDTATLIVVGGANYYVDGGVYYQAENGSDGVVYVVVPEPR